MSINNFVLAKRKIQNSLTGPLLLVHDVLSFFCIVINSSSSSYYYYFIVAILLVVVDLIGGGRYCTNIDSLLAGCLCIQFLKVMPARYEFYWFVS